MLDFLVAVLVVGALAYGIRTYRKRTRQPRGPGAGEGRPGSDAQR